MPRASLFALIVLALLSLVPAAHAAAPLAFQVPDGWVDLSPGAPSANRRSASESALAATGVFKYVRFATAPDDSARMSVIELPEEDTGIIDADYVDRIAKSRLFEKRMPIASSIEKTELVTIAGLTWGRVEATSREGGRLLLFIVPGDPRNALLLFVATPDAYAANLARFEAAARATTGASPSPAKKGDAPVGWIMFVLCVLGLLAAAKSYGRKRSSSGARASKRE